MALFNYVNFIGHKNSHEMVVPITLFVAILCICLVIGSLFEENRWVNESITAIIIVRICVSSLFSLLGIRL